MPRRCNPLVLKGDEIKILAIDVAKLGEAIIRAFDLQDATSSFGRRPVHRLGRYEIRAGVGFPVFLGLPEQGEPLSFADFREVVSVPGPKALLIPFRSALGSDLAAYLDDADVRIFELDDVVVWDARRTLGPRYDPHEFFAALVAKVAPALSTTAPAPIIDLPPGTRWQEVSMAFTGPQTISLAAAGQTRVVGPAELGMGRKNSVKPTVQWRLLQAFAEHAGRLPIGTPSAQKQKQSLSAKLCAATGIAEDPIVAEDGYYETLFAIEGEPLSKGRRDQNRRP